MNKPAEAVEISIAPEEWAAMLLEAGAPKPWADPAAAQRFAAGMTFRWPEIGERKRGTFDRAGEAIAELRRVLPRIIAEDERLLAVLDSPPLEFQDRMVVAARAQTKRELDDLRRLLGALPKLQWELRKPRTPPWQFDAARLYTLYLRHIDPAAGVSADGPAVRFVQHALIRMGSRGPTSRDDAAHAERETIAKALQRWAERARSRPDKSSMA